MKNIIVYNDIEYVEVVNDVVPAIIDNNIESVPVQAFMLIVPEPIQASTDITLPILTCVSTVVEVEPEYIIVFSYGESKVMLHGTWSYGETK